MCVCVLTTTVFGAQLCDRTYNNFYTCCCNKHLTLVSSIKKHLNGYTDKLNKATKNKRKKCREVHTSDSYSTSFIWCAFVKSCVT